MQKLWMVQIFHQAICNKQFVVFSCKNKSNSYPLFLQSAILDEQHYILVGSYGSMQESIEGGQIC